MHAVCMCMCVYNYRVHAIIQERDYYTHCYIRLCHTCTGWPDSFLCCLPERSGGSSSTAAIAAVGRFNLCLCFVVVLFLIIIVCIIIIIILLLCVY